MVLLGKDGLSLAVSNVTGEAGFERVFYLWTVFGLFSEDGEQLGNRGLDLPTPPI